MDERTAMRFWGNVLIGDGCWLWLLGCDQDGYGVTRIVPGETKAHRAAFTLSKGTVPTSLMVLHTCDNPPCVRPSHLYAGTAADNSRDCVMRGRNRRGDRHGRSKLTTSVVSEIRTRYEAGGVTQTELAAAFGVSQGTIGSAIRGTTWVGVQTEVVKRSRRIRDDDAVRIREMLETGMTTGEVADALGLRPKTIRRVRNGETFTRQV